MPFENDDVYEGVSEIVAAGNIKLQGHPEGEGIVLTIAKSEDLPEQYYIISRQEFVEMMRWGFDWVEETSLENILNFDDE